MIFQGKHVTVLRAAAAGDKGFVPNSDLVQFDDGTQAVAPRADLRGDSPSNVVVGQKVPELAPEVLAPKLSPVHDASQDELTHIERRALAPPPAPPKPKETK